MYGLTYNDHRKLKLKYDWICPVSTGKRKFIRTLDRCGSDSSFDVDDLGKVQSDAIKLCDPKRFLSG